MKFSREGFPEQPTVETLATDHFKSRSVIPNRLWCFGLFSEISLYLMIRMAQLCYTKSKETSAYISKSI